MALAAVLLAGALQGASAQALDGPPANLKASAAALYDSYGKDLVAGRGAELAKYYHPDGALRVFNGQARRVSRAALDSNYRLRWTPPKYFSWTGLAYDSIAPGQVLVTGGFLWQAPAQADTATYIYAALLEAVDSGLAIRFEHETLRPRR